jgi:hypothetical protein
MEKSTARIALHQEEETILHDMRHIIPHRQPPIDLARDTAEYHHRIEIIEKEEREMIIIEIDGTMIDGHLRSRLA